MLKPLSGFVFIALCFLACSPFSSVTSAVPFHNPDPGDTDYSIQGEYLGTNAATGLAVGAQVMAQGLGTFRLLILDGGLPGQGWNGIGHKILNGARQGTIASFVQDGFNLSIDTSGDSLRGTNSQGQTLRLAKVHRQSPTLNQTPPAGATVLFDGTSVAAWMDAILDSNHTMSLNTGSSGAITLQSFADFTMHIEFQLPFESEASGQDRGNSGIYLQKRYELQILDSFGQNLQDLFASDTLEPKRQCGAFYEQSAPLVNMAFPPLTWQTYDIHFTAARWDSTGHKTQNAKVTVQQNGVMIHQDRILSGSTLAGDAESAGPAPQRLQYHNHAVSFRNIWIVPG